MTAEQIKTMLEETGLTVSCGAFPDDAGTPAPGPPFILYDTNDDPFYADDCNFTGTANLIVELYTRTRDRAREAALEAVLHAHGMAWDKSSDYMGKQKLHVITYEMGVIINA